MEHARLAWLSVVFQERFGVPLRLWPDSEGGLLLTVRGASGGIGFPFRIESSICPGADIPCSIWSAVAEGWRAPLGLPLPAPGLDLLPRPLVEFYDDGCRIGYDIPWLVWWMLSRIEELGRRDLDLHGRFPASASHAILHGYLDRPVVDEWLDILGQVMLRIWPSLELKRHWFNCMISHDVDRPARYAIAGPRELAMAMAGDLARGHIKKALMGPVIRYGLGKQLHGDDPYNTFDWLMDEAEKRDLQNAFYFKAGRSDPRFDAAYDLRHKKIRNLVRSIHSRGHEIGLHPSYATSLDPEAISAERGRLEEVCAEEGVPHEGLGGRMHYLRWSHPATMAALDTAGMAYDSSLGYADRPGFRCGTCFEYPAFDPVAGKMLRLRLRPLVVMEASVMDLPYMGLGAGDDAFDVMNGLKSACRAVGGNFTLLWHNSSFPTRLEKALFLSILDA